MGSRGSDVLFGGRVGFGLCPVMKYSVQLSDPSITEQLPAGETDLQPVIPVHTQFVPQARHKSC